MKQPSNSLIVKFEDAASLLAEIADMMDCAGYCLHDINEARAQLYETETHCRPAEEPEIEGDSRTADGVT